MLNKKQRKDLQRQALNWLIVLYDTVEIIEQPLTTVVKVKTGDYEGGVFAAINQKLLDGPFKYMLFVELFSSYPRKFRFYTGETVKRK